MKMKKAAALLMALVLIVPMIASTFAASKKTTTRNLSEKGSMIYGSSGEGVKEVQTLLKQYGYYSGAIDGKYGNSTVNAVRRFQSRNGLSADGKVGAKTLAKLKSGDVVTAGGETQGESAKTGSLGLDSSGGDVMQIQTWLKEYGYYNGAIDGFFGKSTESAVKSFQTKNGLRADGVVGALTWAALSGGNVVKANEVFDPYDNYDVSEIQTLLKQYGYYSGEINGDYTSATATAVKKFQTRNGLKADGKVGPLTMEKLLDTANVVKATDMVATYTTLATGSSGKEVENLQLQLRNAMYYTGLIDGVYGPKVVAAVKQFQAAAGLTADGKAGSNTRSALANYQSAIGTYPKRSLRIGCRGYDVYILQQKLVALNYLSAYTKGVYDARMAAAIKKVERDNGLTQDGVYGKTVRRYLWPTALAAQEDQDTIKQVTEYDVSLGNRLQKGSSGEQVAYAQMKLRSAGYLRGSADGLYGDSTEAAVLKLQKAFGLKEDGIIGPETWYVLRYVLTTGLAEQMVVDEDATVGALTRKLRTGTSGRQVKKLQELLVRLGYLAPGQVDGKFGPITQIAVKNFQNDYGLESDGVVGSNTKLILQMLIDGTLNNSTTEYIYVEDTVNIGNANDGGGIGGGDDEEDGGIGGGDEDDEDDGDWEDDDDWGEEEEEDDGDDWIDDEDEDEGSEGNG